jgi:hypothetical protein
MRPTGNPADDTQRWSTAIGSQGARDVSLSTMVSRGVTGRLRPRLANDGASVDRTRVTSLAVRMPGASMRLLEAGLAATAIATAVLIGIGR